MIKEFLGKRNVKKTISENSKKMDYLKTSLKKICAQCECNERTCKYMFEDISVQKIMQQLVNGNYTADIYREAIIIFAMHLFNTMGEYDNVYFIVRSLLDDWFEEYGSNKELETFKYRQIANIMENPKALAEEYFQMYNQKNGKDTIIVSNSNFNFAYEVNVDVDTGIDPGFVLLGYEYEKADALCNIRLKAALRDEQKEWLIFSKMPNISSDMELIWLL